MKNAKKNEEKMWLLKTRSYNDVIRSYNDAIILQLLVGVQYYILIVY